MSDTVAAVTTINYITKINFPAQHLTHLKTKRRPLYLITQSVRRCKHFSSRL